MSNGFPVGLGQSGVQMGQVLEPKDRLLLEHAKQAMHEHEKGNPTPSSPYALVRMVGPDSPALCAVLSEPTGLNDKRALLNQFIGRLESKTASAPSPARIFVPPSSPSHGETPWAQSAFEHAPSNAGKT